MLGLELQDTTVIAVAATDAGQVSARAHVPVDSDLPSAAVRAVQAVVAGAPPMRTLGVAALAPDTPGCAAALRLLATTWSGPFVIGGAVPAGAAAAAAEAWIGAGRGAADLVYFAVATHATAGILQGGRPWSGARGRAGSVAWLALNPVEREDYRKSGCLEAEVSAAGIVRRLVWRVKAGDESEARDLAGGDLGAITIDHVLEAARHNDGVAISVVRDTAKYIGMAAANLVAICDPEMLVLGGIVASARDLLLEQVRVELTRRLPAAMMPRIAPAELGTDAAALGAARLSSVVAQ